MKPIIKSYRSALAIWNLLVLSLIIDLIVLIALNSYTPKHSDIPLYQNIIWATLILAFLGLYKNKLRAYLGSFHNFRSTIQERYGSKIVLPLVALITFATIIEVASRIGIHSLPKLIILGIFSILIIISSIRMYNELCSSINSGLPGNSWLHNNKLLAISLFTPVVARFAASLAMLSFIIGGQPEIAIIQYAVALLIFATGAPSKQDFYKEVTLTHSIEWTVREYTRNISKRSFDRTAPTAIGFRKILSNFRR